MFSQAYVILFTGEQTAPLGADTHTPEQTPPRSRHPPGADTPPADHAGRYGQHVGSTHPTGMQSCFILVLFPTTVNKYHHYDLLAGNSVPRGTAG